MQALPLLVLFIRLLQHDLPSGITVVLAPDVPAEKAAIHATIARPDAATHEAIAARLPRFRADRNDERSLYTIEVERSETAATLQELAKALDTPHRAVVAIVGAADAGVLATIPARKRPKRCRPHEAAPSREIQRGESQFDLVYRTAPAPSADWYALNILADVLGQGEQSRLQRALVGSGLATQYLEGMTESPCSPSHLRMRVRLAPGVATATAEKIIDDELERLGRELITTDELRIAHEQERRWLEEQLATPAGIASALARTALFYGDANRLNSDLARMQAVTAEDVRRVAKKYLGRGAVRASGPPPVPRP